MAIPRNLANLANQLNTDGEAPKIEVGNSSVVVTDTGSNGTIAFTTDGNERMRINSSGTLLINTTSAATGTNTQYALMQIVGNNAGGANYGAIDISRNEDSSSITVDENIGMIHFGDRQAGEYAQIRVAADGTAGSGDYPGRMAFFTTSDGAATPTERARITSAGTLLVGKNTTTANGGVLQVSNGITFPATAVGCSDVNTLDDYEEGTWTPTDASGAGLTLTISGTPSYVKIGSICTVTAFVTYPSTANASAASIGSLPFTVKNIGNSQGATVANTDRGIAITAIGVGNTTQINFTDFSDVNQTNANFSTKFLRFSFTYITS